jgi:hypothetical protein
MSNAFTATLKFNTETDFSAESQTTSKTRNRKQDESQNYGETVMQQQQLDRQIFYYNQEIMSLTQAINGKESIRSRNEMSLYGMNMFLLTAESGTPQYTFTRNKSSEGGDCGFDITNE